VIRNNFSFVLFETGVRFMLKDLFRRQSLFRRAFSSSLRYFKGNNPASPSQAFKGLVQLSERLDKAEVTAAPPDDLLFYPKNFTIKPLFRPTHEEETRAELFRLKYEQAQQLGLKVKDLQIEQLQPKVKAGSFYKIANTDQVDSMLITASDEEVAIARTLFCMPIYAKDYREIIAVLKSYCVLLNVNTIKELVDVIPGGIVIYVIEHPRAIEEARTLLYLEHTYFDTQIKDADNFGYEEVYEKFLYPKVRVDINNKPITAHTQDFFVKAITSSYSNRILDIAMGILTQRLQKQGIDPEPFLRRTYVLNLIANPYNFVSSWRNNLDWRTSVLMHPMVDTVWGFHDIATRVLPKIDLFLTLFQLNDKNRICISEGQRQAIIIVPTTHIDYNQCVDAKGRPSLNQVAVNLLGHGLNQAVDTLQTQEPHFVAGVNKFFRGQITQQEFKRYRERVDHTYFYNSEKNIPLCDLVDPKQSPDLHPYALVENTIEDAHGHWDLYQLLSGQPLNEDPSWLNLRIIKNLEIRLKPNSAVNANEEEGEGAVPFTMEYETTMDYHPLDWLYSGQAHGEDVYIVVIGYLASFNIMKRSQELILKNPELSAKLLQLYHKLLSTSPAEIDAGSQRLVDIFNNNELFGIYNNTTPVVFKFLSDLPSDSKKYLSTLKPTDFKYMDTLHEIRKLHSYPSKSELKKIPVLPMLRYAGYAWGEESKLSRQFVNRFYRAHLPINEVVDACLPLIQIFAKAALELLKSTDINDVYCASINRYFMSNYTLKLRASIAAYYSYLQQYSLLSDPKVDPLIFSDSYFRAMRIVHHEDPKEKKERIEELKQTIKIVRRFPPPPAELSEEEKLQAFMQCFKNAKEIYYNEFIREKVEREANQRYEERRIASFMDSGLSRERIATLLQQLSKELALVDQEEAPKVNGPRGFIMPNVDKKAVLSIQFYLKHSLRKVPDWNKNTMRLLIMRELHETDRNSININDVPREQYIDDETSDNDKDAESAIVEDKQVSKNFSATARKPK